MQKIVCSACVMDQFGYEYYCSNLHPAQSFASTLTFRLNACSISYIFSVLLLKFNLFFCFISSCNDNPLRTVQFVSGLLWKPLLIDLETERKERWWVGKGFVAAFVDVAYVVEEACKPWDRLAPNLGNLWSYWYEKGLARRIWGKWRGVDGNRWLGGNTVRAIACVTAIASRRGASNYDDKRASRFLGSWLWSAYDWVSMGDLSKQSFWASWRRKRLLDGGNKLVKDGVEVKTNVETFPESDFVMKAITRYVVDLKGIVSSLKIERGLFFWRTRVDYLLIAEDHEQRLENGISDERYSDSVPGFAWNAEKAILDYYSSKSSELIPIILELRKEWKAGGNEGEEMGFFRGD